MKDCHQQVEDKKQFGQVKVFNASHLVTYFKIQKYYQKEPRFNGVHSINNLPKIKDRTYVIDLYECKSTKTHLIVLYANGDNVASFDGNRNITTNIFRTQANDSIK